MILQALRVALTAALAFVPFGLCLAIDMGKRLDFPFWARIAQLLGYGTGLALFAIGVVGTVGALIAERAREPSRRARNYLRTWLVVAALCAILPTQGIAVLMVPVALIAALVWERIQKRCRVPGAVPFTP
ncbi:MAG: hypothetical protein ACO1SV_04920 [Fimbriimonas sp.]